MAGQLWGYIPLSDEITTFAHHHTVSALGLFGWTGQDVADHVTWVSAARTVYVVVYLSVMIRVLKLGR